MDDGIKLDNVWAAAEVGKVVDPIMFENMVQGGINWALDHAIMSEITYSDGMTEQENFDTFESLRMYQSPKIEVVGLENGDHVRGIGEPMVPPAAAALSNAIFAATGQRIREMPMNRFIDFVYAKHMGRGGLWKHEVPRRGVHKRPNCCLKGA